MKARALCSGVALMVGLIGCTGAVEDAREDGAQPPRRVLSFPVPDVSADAQRCAADSDCVLLYGVPGQRLDALCCATCEPPAALSLDTAAAVVIWREGLDCRQVACGPAPACIDHNLPTSACVEGRCVRVYEGL